MSSHLSTLSLTNINPEKNVNQLESGKILFFPDHCYPSLDKTLLSESILDGRHKNISYDYKRKKLGAFNKKNQDLEQPLTQLMQGYAEFAYQLLEKTLPEYVPHLQWGRTSYRPAQISGRASSKRKDDTRLHVDSFSATPVNGLRILRVFCNVNPQEEPRVWHVGEPFTQVLQRFAPGIKPYNRFKAHALNLVKTTKTLRSSYDHYMLHLHDHMKYDDEYQRTVQKTPINFPAQCSWIVYTDHVSHAALSGQYLLEQTFYLPIEAMANSDYSPLKEWQKIRPECSAF